MKSLLLILISLITGLVLFEFALRWFAPQYDPSGRVSFVCMKGAFHGIPGTVNRQWTNTGEFDVEVAINQYGFRDAKDIATGNSVDWIVVGDSFSFGQGVHKQNRYSNLLDQSIAETVYNISIPNNFNGYFYLLEHALQLNPKLNRVILGVSMENDLALYPRDPAPCMESDPGKSAADVNQGNWSSKRGMKLWLNQNLALYSLVTTAIQTQPALRNLAINFGVVDKNQTFAGVNFYNDRVLRASANRLRHLAKTFDLLVLIIPSRGLWQGDNTEEIARIHRRFIKLLEKDRKKSNRLNVLDLRPVMESGGNPLFYHYPNEGHWNDAGHSLAAKAIKDHLTDNPL